ncbi:MAG: hypothetical protein PWQ91_1497 [Eubacteriales bacterium]|nr:hypothetical protein [Eubacteriales bacterium]MDN5364435.1 hypothetical protein [Eubacteriales bacterium]
MKIILVGGFLGSGKTTFIRHLAAFLVLEKQKKVVVLENEFGEVSIDDQFLAKKGFMVKGIYGGCICCQLTGKLVVAVNQIAEEMAPDYLIIESTGLARPDTVLKNIRDFATGRAADASDVIIVLVDASRWEGLSELTPDLIFAQIEAANVLIVSKIDELEKDPKFVVDELVKVNERAKIITGNIRNGLDKAILEELSEYV